MPTSFVITESDINQGLDLMLRERSRSSFIISEHDIDLEMDLLLLEQGKVKKVGPGRIQKAIETGDPKTTSRLLDNSQKVLDVLGLGTAVPFPPITLVGEVATVLSFIMNVSRGKYAWALFDLFAMVPIAGGFAKAGKLGKAAKAAAAAGKLKSGAAMVKVFGSAKAARQVTTAVQAASAASKVAKATESGVGLIVDLIPKDLMGKLIEAEIPPALVNFVPEDLKDETFVGFMLEISKNIPAIGDKIPEVQKVWEEVKKTYYEGGFADLPGGEISGDEAPGDEAPGVAVKKPDIRIHDWSGIETGFVSVAKGFKWVGDVPQKAWRKAFPDAAQKYIDMFIQNRILDAIVVHGNSLVLEAAKALDLDDFYVKYVQMPPDILQGFSLTLDKFFDVLTGKEDYETEEYDKIEQAIKKVFVQLSDKLKSNENSLTSDASLAQKYNETQELYYNELDDQIKSSIDPDKLREPEKEDTEQKIKDLEAKIKKQEDSLAEGKLVDIVIDFNEIRSKQLDESFLTMFGGWVEWLLGKMFGTGHIPGKIVGTKSEISSFAAAMGSEKRYIETAKRYGLNHPTTYKNKAKLDRAAKGFEKETGIKWPFK